jgi:hypothetical protein
VSHHAQHRLFLLLVRSWLHIVICLPLSRMSVFRSRCLFYALRYPQWPAQAWHRIGTVSVSSELTFRLTALKCHSCGYNPPSSSSLASPQLTSTLPCHRKLHPGTILGLEIRAYTLSQVFFEIGSRKLFARAGFEP